VQPCVPEVFHEVPQGQPFAYCLGGEDGAPVVDGGNAFADKPGSEGNIAGYDEIACGCSGADVLVGAAFGFLRDNSRDKGVFSEGNSAVGDKNSGRFP
jgi:hypothetical protein